MTYKDCEIMANAKQYSLWSVDETGKLDELQHEYEGADIISYTFQSDKHNILGGDFGDFETIEQTKKAIDKEVTR